MLEPERVAVSDAVGPVADRVTRGHLDVGVGAAHRLADEAAELCQGLVRDRRELSFHMEPLRATCHDIIGAMRLEVIVEQNETGQFAAKAVEYPAVSATGRTEKEALVRLLDALELHMKQGGKPTPPPTDRMA